METEKRTPRQCYSPGCDTPIAWQFVDKGRVIGGLCEQHKVSWYDAQPKHKTTLVKVNEEGQYVAESEAQERGLSLPVVANVPSIGQPGQLRLTQEEQAILGEDPLADSIQIKPNGVPFVGWTEVADILDRAFGIGEWSLYPDGKPFMDDGTMTWQFHLFVHGNWVATAIGEHPDPRNEKMSFANRAEAAKSDALVKCSKALGVFRKLWDKHFLTEWKKEYAVEVLAKQAKWSNEFRPLWRRKDAEPFYEERAPKDDRRAEGVGTRSYMDDAKQHLETISKEK